MCNYSGPSSVLNIFARFFLEFSCSGMVCDFRVVMFCKSLVSYCQLLVPKVAADWWWHCHRSVKASTSVRQLLTFPTMDWTRNELIYPVRTSSIRKRREYLPTCMMMLTKLLVSMPSYQGVAKRSCFRLLNCSSNTRVVSVCIVRSLYGFKLLRATPIGSLEVLCVDRG